MVNDDLEIHLKVAISNLEVVKHKYMDMGNRHKADIISRALSMVTRSHEDLMHKWYMESLEREKLENAKKQEIKKPVQEATENKTPMETGKA